MNSVIADFVGLLGPGQVVDRHALVAVPAGFLKVIICNTVSDVCLMVSEFKENLKDTCLGIKISVKGYLCIGDDIIDAISIPISQKSVFNLDCNAQILKFDKSLRRRRNVLFEVDSENFSTDEVLQICVYASKKGSRAKNLVGFVHISLNSITFGDGPGLNIDSWYKVFPSTSFVAGYPMLKGNQHHINSSSDSTTPTSPAPSELLEWITSSPTSKKNLPSSSASDSTSESLVKKNSFRLVARTLARLLQKDKSNSSTSLSPSKSRSELDKASTSAMEASSSNESVVLNSNNRLSKRQKSWSILPQKHLQKETNNTLKNRPASEYFEKRSRMGSLLRLKFRRSYYETNCEYKSRIRRCEEVICSPAEEDGPSIWEQNATADSNLCYGEVSSSSGTQSQYVGLELKSLSSKRKPNSVGSESVDLSSTETGEVDTDQRKAKQSAAVSIKVAASVSSWARKVQKRSKFQTLPLSAAPQSDGDFAFSEHDNVYAVLKFLQTLPQSKSEERTTNSFEQSDVIKAISTSSNSLAEKKVVIEPKIAPANSKNFNDSKDYYEKTGSSHFCCTTIECQQKRESFAKNRGFGLTDTMKLNSSLLSVATRRLSISDDDYVSCSERLSSTDLSIVSCYTTASEKK